VFRGEVVQRKLLRGPLCAPDVSVQTGSAFESLGSRFSQFRSFFRTKKAWTCEQWRRLP
jgi:hypothetical protein